MFDFLDVARRLLRTNAVEDKRAEFELVFRAIGALQTVHSKSQLDLNNIESVFTVLELGRIIQKVPGLTRDEIPAAIAALKKLIVRTLGKRGFNRFAHFHALGVNLHRRESSNQLGFHPFIAAF